MSVEDQALKTSLFMATTAPGLELVAQEEIAAKLDGVWTHATFRGRILFGALASLEELLTLRCVDNVFAHIAWLQAGSHKQDLQQLAHTLASLDLSPALAHLDLPSRRPRVIVSASRSGKHAYSRFDAADAVLERLEKEQGFRRGTPSDYDAAFRLDVIDDQALFSLKLTPPEFRFRGQQRQFSRAALRPTIAAALVWLSRPDDGDVFLDPFCGSGTIAIERGAYKAQRIIASDVSEDALAVTRRNATAQGIRLEAHPWDARTLKLDAASVSAIVTNPPWGGQIDVGSDLPMFYREFLSEAKRVLAPRGTIHMLTDQKQAVEDACSALGLHCTALSVVSLHGLLPTVYRIV